MNQREQARLQVLNSVMEYQLDQGPGGRDHGNQRTPAQANPGGLPEGRGRRAVPWQPGPPATWTRLNVNGSPPWNRLLRRRWRAGVVRGSQSGTSCTGRRRQPSRPDGRRCSTPESRDSPSGPPPGTWVWSRTLRRSTRRQALHLPRKSAPRPRLWPHLQSSQINPGDIFAFQKWGRNRWTTTNLRSKTTKIDNASRRPRGRWDWTSTRCAGGTAGTDISHWSCWPTPA